jgi:polyisoprenoid-binding protein YceI
MLTYSIAGLSTALVLSSAAMAEKYVIDSSHSTVGFKVKHLAISSVPGRFGEFSGTFDFDPAHFDKSSAEVAIDAKSINTDNQKRDDHLRGPDFFDIAKNPRITFKTTKIEPVSKSAFKATGDLTLHGVTKPVTLDVQFEGEATDPYGNKRAGFSATTSLNRKAFGITWNKALDAGGVVLGDEVKIVLEVEGIQEKKAG